MKLRKNRGTENQVVRCRQILFDIMKNCTKSGCKNCKKGRKDKNALHFMQNGRIIYANGCVDYMNMHP